MDKFPIPKATEIFMSYDEVLRKKPMTEKEFFKKADENGVRLDKKSESSKNAYSAYLAIVLKETVQIELTEASIRTNTTINRETNNATVIGFNPEYANPIETALRNEYVNTMQKEDGGATVQNVQGTFNNGKTDELAVKAGNNWVYAKNPISNSTIRGFIMINGTNTTPFQRGINITEAVKTVLLN
jgi:hypothetical protein